MQAFKFSGQGRYIFTPGIGVFVAIAHQPFGRGTQSRNISGHYLGLAGDHRVGQIRRTYVAIVSFCFQIFQGLIVVVGEYFIAF
jgi:hypothetical protein